MSNLIYDIRKRANLTAYLVDDLISLDIVYPTPLAVTLANMRLSLAAGAAFVDFSSAGALTPYLGSKIEIIDSAGKKATGYIKAAGTGETLGTEILTGWTNVDYETLTSAGTNITSAIETGVYGQVISNLLTSIPKGAAVKIVTDLTVNSGATPGMGIFDGVNWWFIEDPLTAGAQSNYFTTEGEGSLALMLFANAAAANWECTCSVKQITGPSATGVTIVSTPGGSTYNWTSIETGFNYNDASGYTCQIYTGGHVYKCTTAGISAASQPTFKAGPGETTTDGTVVWTECNPSGVTYAGALTFEREFRYRDMRRRMKYAQPIDYSIAGDVYCYDKQAAVARQTREISYDRMTEADYVSLLDFVAIVQGARFNFLFTDENGVEHQAKLLSDTIESTPPFSGYEGEIRIELYLIT